METCKTLKQFTNQDDVRWSGENHDVASKVPKFSEINKIAHMRLNMCTNIFETYFKIPVKYFITSRFNHSISESLLNIGWNLFIYNVCLCAMTTWFWEWSEIASCWKLILFRDVYYKFRDANYKCNLLCVVVCQLNCWSDIFSWVACDTWFASNLLLYRFLASSLRGC